MTTVHHLALRVADVDAALAFYRHWLGLSLVRDARPRSVWLGLGAGAVLMLEQRAEGEPAPDPASQELLAFHIAGAEKPALRQRLEEAGLLAGETEYTLYFRDPEGRRLGLSWHPLTAR